MSHFRSKSWEVWLLLLAYISPFVFPFYLIRFELAGIPFTFTEVFTYFFFAIFLLTVLLKMNIVRWEKPARWYYYFALIFLIGATLGVITAPHYIALPSGELMDSQMKALGIWKGWVVAPLLYFFTITQVVDTGEKMKRLLLYFVYSAAFVSLVSYGLAVFADGFTYDLRLAGFFESANYLSLYILPALLLGIYFVLSDQLERRDELLNLASVTILVHALFLTQSYASIIGLFGAIGLYILVLIFRHRAHFLKIFVSLFLLLFVFALIAAGFSQTSKFKQFVDFENRSSSSVRLEVYEISWNLINDYPLTGIGPGLFQGYYQTKGPGYLGHAPMEWNIPHPHNIFMAFWLNAGLLGLFSLLGMIVLAHRKLTYPLLAFWGILIHGFFDTPFWKNDLAMIFWLILGAILILQTYGTDSSHGGKGPIRKRTRRKRSKSARTKKFSPSK